MKLHLPKVLFCAVIAACGTTYAADQWTTPAFGGTEHIWTGSGGDNSFDNAGNWQSGSVPDRADSMGPVYVYDGVTVDVHHSRNVNTSDQGGIKAINNSVVSSSLGEWGGSIYVEEGSTLNASIGVQLKNTEAETAANVYAGGQLNLSGPLDFNDGNTWQNWQIDTNGNINIVNAQSVTKGNNQTWNIQYLVPTEVEIGLDDSAIVNRTKSDISITHEILSWTSNLRSSIDTISLINKDTSSAVDSNTYTLADSATGLSVTYTAQGYTAASLQTDKDITWTHGGAGWTVVGGDGTDTSFLNGDTVTFTGNGTAIVQGNVVAQDISVADGVDYTLALADNASISIAAEKTVFQDIKLTGGDTTSLHLNMSTNREADGDARIILKEGSSVGSVYVKGTFAYNLHSAALTSNLAGADLHMADQSVLLVRNNQNSAAAVFDANIGDIYFDGANGELRVYGGHAEDNKAIEIQDNIYASSTTLTKTDGGYVKLSGEMDVKTLRVNNGKVTLAGTTKADLIIAKGGSGITMGGTTTTNALMAGGANININGTVNANQIRLKEQGGGVVTVQEGGTLNITGSNNEHTTSASILLAHWDTSNGGGTLNTGLVIDGGTLNAANAVVKTSWSSAGFFHVLNGTANVKGISFWAQDNATSGEFVLGSDAGDGTARINLGSEGIGDASSNVTINLSNGILGATGNWYLRHNTGGSPPTGAVINLTGRGTGTVFDTSDANGGATGHTITVQNAMSGEGYLVARGNGTLVLNGAVTAGGVTVESGSTANFNAGLTVNGKMTVAESATATINGTSSFNSTISNSGNLTIGGTISASGTNFSKEGGTVSYSDGGTDGFLVYSDYTYHLVEGVNTTLEDGYSFTYNGQETTLTSENGQISFTSDETVTDTSVYHVITKDFTVDGTESNLAKDALSYDVAAGRTLTIAANQSDTMTAANILATTTGEGNVAVATDITLTNGTSTTSKCNLIINKDKTLQVGTGGANAAGASIASFSTVELAGGNLNFNTASSSVNSLTVTADSGMIVQYTGNPQPTLTLKETTTLQAGTTLTVTNNDSGKLKIEKLAGQGDLVVDGSGWGHVLNLEVLAFDNYSGAITFDGNNITENGNHLQLGSTWNGHLTVRDYADTSNRQRHLEFISKITEGGKLSLSNVNGWMSNQTVAAHMELTGAGLKLTNGSSITGADVGTKANYTFAGGVSGDGNFEINLNGGPNNLSTAFTSDISNWKASEGNSNHILFKTEGEAAKTYYLFIKDAATEVNVSDIKAEGKSTLNMVVDHTAAATINSAITQGEGSTINLTVSNTSEAGTTFTNAVNANSVNVTDGTKVSIGNTMTATSLTMGTNATLDFSGGTLTVTNSITLGSVSVSDMAAYFDAGNLTSTTLVTAGGITGWNGPIVGEYTVGGTTYTTTIDQNGNTITLNFEAEALSATGLVTDVVGLENEMLTLVYSGDLAGADSAMVTGISDAIMKNILGLTGLPEDGMVGITLQDANGVLLTASADKIISFLGSDGVSVYQGNVEGSSREYQVQYIPEPATATLSLLALAALAARRRRMK